MDDKKDFFHIGKMTEEFRKLSKEHLIANSPEAYVWHLRFELAIAQQLSVISAHLGKIVESAEVKK
jgi:hypothetical protein